MHTHMHGDDKESLGRDIRRKEEKSWRNEQEESLENKGKVKRSCWQGSKNKRGNNRDGGNIGREKVAEHDRECLIRWVMEQKEKTIREQGEMIERGSRKG